MTSLARWCFNRRWIVLAIWLVALIGAVAVGKSVGATYSNSFSLPGTDSQHVQDVLSEDFPARAGDSDQIVLQAREGTLRSPEIESAVAAMLAQVSQLPHVRSVTSPYRASGQISQDGTIGFATVTFDAQARDLPKAVVTTLISTAQAAKSPQLNVQLGGRAIEKSQQNGGSADLLIGSVFALVILFFAFRRSVLGALLPLVSALVATVAGTSIIDILTHTIAIPQFAPQVAIIMALGVGVDYALFIVSRHRTELLAGQTPEDAAVIALNSAGRAVLLAGLTVCVALLGLLALQVSFLYGVAVSATVAVGLTMLASLTLLPAMLGFFGLKVLRRAERDSLGQPRAREEHNEGFWSRWSALVSRTALISGLLAFGAVVVLALPFLNMRQGLPDASTDPESSTTHQAYALLAQGFGPGFNGPLLVVGQVASPADQARFAEFMTSLQRDPGVARVESPRLSPNGKAEIAVVYPTTGPQDARTADLLQRIRSAAPRAEAGTSLAIHVGGNTAANEDYSHVLAAKMPQFVAVVVGLAFLLLAVVLRSLLIPLVASIMNLLSFGAALGVMTAAFQFGWGKSVLGFSESGPIVTYLPVMMFAILFGLSMDYEVFLISRMHEEWLRSGDNARAVARGQTETGGVITAAALIMMLVFASFIFGGQFVFKQVGLGFAAAVFVDAFIIRTVLVPAVMHLLGRANWWMPAWLDRILPRLQVEPTDGIILPHADLVAVEPSRDPSSDVLRHVGGSTSGASRPTR